MCRRYASPVPGDQDFVSQTIPRRFGSRRRCFERESIAPARRLLLLDSCHRESSHRGRSVVGIVRSESRIARRYSLDCRSIHPDRRIDRYLDKNQSRRRVRNAHAVSMFSSIDRRLSCAVRTLQIPNDGVLHNNIPFEPAYDARHFCGHAASRILLGSWRCMLGTPRHACRSSQCRSHILHNKATGS